MHRSSIVRLAHKLDLSGFPELQTKARDALLKSFSPSNELYLTRAANVQVEMVEQIYQRELMNLRQTYKYLDLPALEATAREIAAAKRVVLFGRRFSYPIAQYLSLALHTMPIEVRATPEPGGTTIDTLFDLTPHDYALISVNHTLLSLISRYIVKKRLGRYKAPKSVDFVDALPKTGSSKLMKRVLRDWYR